MNTPTRELRELASAVRYYLAQDDPIAPPRVRQAIRGRMLDAIAHAESVAREPSRDVLRYERWAAQRET